MKKIGDKIEVYLDGEIVTTTIIGLNELHGYVVLWDGGWVLRDIDKIDIEEFGIDPKFIGKRMWFLDEEDVRNCVK